MKLYIASITATRMFSNPNNIIETGPKLDYYHGVAWQFSENEDQCRKNITQELLTNTLKESEGWYGHQVQITEIPPSIIAQAATYHEKNYKTALRSVFDSGK